MTATLDEGTRSEPTTVTLSVPTIDINNIVHPEPGTATPSLDFGAPNTLSDDTVDLTIPADQISASMTYSFQVWSDNIDERDETISVSGSAASDGTPIAVTSTSMTITDHAEDVASTTDRR